MELTKTEQTAMNEAMRPYWVERDGLLPKEERAFEAGFKAGLAYVREQPAPDAALVEALRGFVHWYDNVDYDQVEDDEVLYAAVNATRAALASVEPVEGGK